MSDAAGHKPKPLPHPRLRLCEGFVRSAIVNPVEPIRLHEEARHRLERGTKRLAISVWAWVLDPEVPDSAGVRPGGGQIEPAMPSPVLPAAAAPGRPSPLTPTLRVNAWPTLRATVRHLRLPNRQIADPAELLTLHLAGGHQRQIVTIDARE